MLRPSPDGLRVDLRRLHLLEGDDTLVRALMALPIHTRVHTAGRVLDLRDDSDRNLWNALLLGALAGPTPRQR